MEAFVSLPKRSNIANASNDQNIGSARDGTSQDNSVSGLVTSLVLNLIIFTVFVLIFILLRRTHRRVYAPRTFVSTVQSHRRLNAGRDDRGVAHEVEGVGGFSGMLSWISGVWKIPDEVVLRTNGLDGFFFLRYLRKAQLMCFVGCCITFPLLFPLNATGSAPGVTGLSVLTFGKIGDDQKNRLYAHVFISWIFYVFVLFTVYRELMYYITLRQAYMLSPMYSERISARTVLITTIPNEYLNESALMRVFEHVSRIWINTDSTKLEELVEERDKITLKLEAAEVKLIRAADKVRRKQGGEADKDDAQPGIEAEGESGSVAARWLPRKKRPTHKLKLMGLFGDKVDTIDWCRGRLAELNPKIEELQALQQSGEAKKLNSAFIEFTSQSAAQAALQTLAHNKPLHMAPRYIGITPEEIIWSNLKLQWWERLVKVWSTTTFVVALVIFWSIPVAVVGAISQIDYLEEKIQFLSFINKIPNFILGVVTGILPSVMLAVLMSLLPIILRLMARIAGEPSLSRVELRVQNMYFAFQVVQVFLVTTMTSAASSAVPSILQNPSSVTSVLASNLPKASNFYISYMILQGLSISAGALLQVVGLILYKVLSMLFDNTPRKMFKRWSSLSGLGWGTVFPIYSNICVIALTYSIIAPLIMLFAVIGFGLLYFAYRYNFLFVYNVDIDTKGMVYPRALFQTLTGIYLSQICLIGLFAIKTAIGPLILEVVILVATILFQIALQNAISPLLQFLPKNLEREEQSLMALEGGHRNHKAPATSDHTDVRASEADEDFESGATEIPAQKSGTWFSRFFHPETYATYEVMRKKIPRNFPEIAYTPEMEQASYLHPSTAAEPMVIWVPRDEGGISKQEVAHTEVVNPISDEGAVVNAKSKVERVDDAVPPMWSEKPVY